MRINKTDVMPDVGHVDCFCVWNTVISRGVISITSSPRSEETWDTNITGRRSWTSILGVKEQRHHLGLGFTLLGSQSFGE